MQKQLAYHEIMIQERGRLAYQENACVGPLSTGESDSLAASGVGAGLWCCAAHETQPANAEKQQSAGHVHPALWRNFAPWRGKTSENIFVDVDLR
jgi:hypothetical protein